MNTMVGSARRIGRTENGEGASPSATWRRLAAWWSADAVSLRFASARTADERLLDRR